MSMSSLGDIPLFAGKYRLVRALGKGAMGEVWLAEEEGPRNFRRRVAVKRLLSAGDIGDVATESFVAEAQVIARLDHPNVVRLIELGNAEGGLYLVLDFVDGAALDRIYKKTGALSPGAVAYIGREVARALEAVHGMCDDHGHNYGVVHRDVTPSNILLSRDGRVRLSDFGVARISGLGGERTETGVFKGKLPYMPPEQARGEPFDGRADIFALGVTLFEGLLGRRIRRAETQTQLLMMIASEAVPRVLDLLPGAPAALAHAIDRATELDPRRRVADAGELSTMLDDALRELGPTALKDAQAEVRARVLDVAGAPQAGANSPSAGRIDAPPKPAEWSVALGTGSASRTGPFQPASMQTLGSVQPPGAPPSSVGQSVTNVVSSRDAGSPSSLPPNTRRSIVVPALVLVGFTVLGGVGAFLVLSRSATSPRTEGSTSLAAASAAAPSQVVAAASPDAVKPNELTVPAVAESPAPSASPVAAGPAAGGVKPADTRRTGASPAPTASAAVETSNEPGTLVVTVLPWADVSVDGRSVGTTPLAPISLPPGPHSVVLRNGELGASRSLSVTVKPGKPAQLRVDLRRSE